MPNDNITCTDALVAKKSKSLIYNTIRPHIATTYTQNFYTSDFIHGRHFIAGSNLYYVSINVLVEEMLQDF